MSESVDKVGQIKTGSICAFITGLGFILILICALFAPSAIASYIATNAYFNDFTSYKYFFIFLKWMMAITNISMIGVIVSLYRHHQMEKYGYFLFFSISAIVGLGIGVLQSVTDATVVPHLYKVYEHSSETIKHIIIAFGVANPAIYSISLGLPGIWFIIYSVHYRSSLPIPLFLLNLSWGVGNIVTVIAHMNVWIWLIHTVVIAALILVPFWTFFQTRFLWKSAIEHKKML